MGIPEVSMSHFEKPNNISWIKKEVLTGPFGNFEVLNGPVLLNFFRTSPKGTAVRWYTTQLNLLNFENWCNGEVSKIGHQFRK